MALLGYGAQMFDRIVNRVASTLYRVAEALDPASISIGVAPDDEPSIPVAGDFMAPSIKTGEPELVRLRRVAGEYFDMVRKFEAQRDEWRAMFHQQAREHHAAQVSLQDDLARMQRIARAVVQVLNGARTEKGLPPLTTIAELESTLPDLAAVYERRMNEIDNAAEPILDAERALKELPAI